MVPVLLRLKQHSVRADEGALDAFLGIPTVLGFPFPFPMFEGQIVRASPILEFSKLPN